MLRSTKTSIFTLSFLGLFAAVGLWAVQGRTALQNPHREVSSVTSPIPTDLVRDASSILNVDRAEIVMNNDLAFQRKIEALKTAGRGSQVRLVYYIYHDDHSASYFSQELINAAHRGAKVKVLLDYFYNYRHLDMFTMMEREAAKNNLGGSLEVRFYNRPTKNMIKDIVYMTTPCPKAMEFKDCPAAKDKIVNDMFAHEGQFSNLNNGMSGLFFSGFYEKDARLMATAVLKGQQLDLAKLKGASGGAKMSDADKAALKDILKTYWTSKTGDALEQLGAGIKLAFAKLFFGDKIKPLFETLESVAPTSMSRETGSAREWEFWTDFTHHKLLLVDDKYIMLGGRNIENSYHMNPNPLLEKYLFWDTDVYAVLNSGGDKVAQSFDELFNFRSMVASLPEVRMHAPNEAGANNRIISQICHEKFVTSALPGEVTFGESPAEAVSAIAKEELKKLISDCITEEAKKDPLTLDQRVAIRKARMEERSKIFVEKVIHRVAGREVFESGERFFKDLPDFIKIPQTDLVQSLVAYVENLPYNKNIPVAQRTRSLGTTDRNFRQDGKYIHSQWLEGYRRTCQASAADGKEREIVVYNAYFYPSSLLLKSWKELLNGTYDCGKVTMKIITNSVKSTDLAVVNALATHQMRAFFQYYEAKKDPKRAMKFELYEINPIASNAHISLHSKVTLMGDDIMIGSANADIRSYHMDSNNSMLFRNAPETAAKYKAYFDKLLGLKGRAVRTDQVLRVTTNDKLVYENRKAFDIFLNKYHFLKTPMQTYKVKVMYDSLLIKAYEDTIDFLNGDDNKAEQFNDFFKVI